MRGMATPPSDDTIMLFKLLADGEWHPYQEIKDKLGASVPPGRALRKYEEAYRAGRVQRNAEPVTSPLSEDDQIRYGGLKCAQVTISSWKGKGVIQRMVNGEKEIRMKPGFQSYRVNDGAGQAPDPPQEAEGYTEVPPSDSEPSESPPPRPQEVSEPSVVEQVEQAAPESVGVEQVEPEPPMVPPLQPLPASDYQLPPLSPAVTAREPVECPECGLDVVNESRHQQWHEGLRKAAEARDIAFVDEKRLRSLILAVFVGELDRFQVGMQEYLEQQFGLVNAQFFALRHDYPGAQRWTARDQK